LAPDCFPTVLTAFSREARKRTLLKAAAPPIFVQRGRSSAGLVPRRQVAWVETQFQDYYGSGLISGAMPSLSFPPTLSIRDASPHRFGGSAGSCRQQGSSWVVIQLPIATKRCPTCPSLNYGRHRSILYSAHGEPGSLHSWITQPARPNDRPRPPRLYAET
jgi:hypothetical protein